MAEPNLPRYLDPLLDILYDVLPPAVFDTLMQITATAIAVGTTTYTLIQAAVAARPWEWDKQVFLPPLIALGCVCIVLYIIYRSILYMVRSIIWTIKWGAILGTLIAGVGYLMSLSGENGLANGGGVGGGMPNFAAMLFSMMNPQRSRGGGRSRRPGATESFDQHREWQYAENDGAAGNVQNEDLQRLMDGVINTVRGGDIFGVAQGVMNAFTPRGGDRPRRPRRQQRASEGPEMEDVD